MFRVGVALMLLMGCASRTMSGRIFEADVPDGWRVAESPLESSVRPLIDLMPRGAVTLASLSDDRGHTITAIETTKPREPEPDIAPQARLMGSVMTPTPTPTPTELSAALTAQCPKLFERLHLSGAAYAVDYGGLHGCESSFAAEDGPASFTMLLVGDAAAVVYLRCSRGTPELDRACERVLRSIRLRTSAR